jgi:ribosomal protein S18 acetylase RimI-like enzyme
VPARRPSLLFSPEVEVRVRGIRLAPMTEAEFLTFRDTEARGYAGDKVRSGDWSDRDAMTLALQAFHRLVPSGPETAGHHLFTVHDAETAVKVGWLWFEVRDDGLSRTAFLSDILIFDEYQRQGYGTACLAEFDNQARSLGIRRVRLHVFGHNMEAKKLYERCGYQVTDCFMAKDLS